MHVGAGARYGEKNVAEEARPAPRPRRGSVGSRHASDVDYDAQEAQNGR